MTDVIKQFNTIQCLHEELLDSLVLWGAGLALWCSRTLLQDQVIC